MTTLRDDGYLETDDPVVAVCFLGKEAKFIMWDTREVSSELYRINAIMPNGWNNHGWPLLVPAATVAEVCRLTKVGEFEVWQHQSKAWTLVANGVDSGKLASWLRKHTEEINGNS